MQQKFLRISVLVVALVLASDPAQASSQELFGGELGVWLRSEAQPQLRTLLEKHPRFRGERVRVVAMRGGLPSTETDELNQAIRTQLTHTLAQVKGLQLVWSDSSQGCGVQKKTSYLLGVEVLSESRSRHLVRVAMVDVDEGLWISGAHWQWRGSLTSAEQRAFGDAVFDAPLGTIDKPLAVTSRSALVEQLLQGIDCTLRGGLDGSVHVTSADEHDPLLVDLADRLRERLLLGALLTVAQTGSQADWQLQLSSVSDVGSSVVATLSAVSGGKADTPGAQRLAAVHVHRTGLEVAAKQPPSVFPTQVEAQTRAQASSASDRSQPLIERLQQVTAQVGEQCYRASANCLEVELELAEPGYLMVLRTDSDGGLNLGSCKGPEKAQGSKRFRLSTLRGSGFYGLATKDRQVAAMVHRELLRGAQNCTAAFRQADESGRGNWLEGLELLIEAAAGKLHWQALYFSAVEPERSGALAERQTRVLARPDESITRRLY